LALIGSYLFGLQGFFVGALMGNVVMAAISYRLFTKQFTHGEFRIEEQMS